MEDEEEEEEVEEEPYFPHELTSPEPIYEYGRDILSPRSVSEPTADGSRASSELTFSEYVFSFSRRFLQLYIVIIL